MRFYTLPPRTVEWPYLLVNMRIWKELWRRKFKHAILDSGVEVFKTRPHLKDYPKSLLFRYAQRAEIVSKRFEGRVWVTIPDYPDDITPGRFGDNVDKTLKNIEEFITIDGVEWLPVIQCRYLNLLSFYESCHKMRKLIAVYPEDICIRPIKASCPEQVCVKCGLPKESHPPWCPSCKCDRPEYMPGVVLDPMCGSGTTLVAAKKLGRQWIGIDINPAYCEMAKRRLSAIPEKLTKFLK